MVCTCSSLPSRNAASHDAGENSEARGSQARTASSFPPRHNWKQASGEPPNRGALHSVHRRKSPVSSRLGQDGGSQEGDHVVWPGTPGAPHPQLYLQILGLCYSSPPSSLFIQKITRSAWNRSWRYGQSWVLSFVSVNLASSRCHLEREKEKVSSGDQPALPSSPSLCPLQRPVLANTHPLGTSGHPLFNEPSQGFWSPQDRWELQVTSPL